MSRRLLDVSRSPGYSKGVAAAENPDSPGFDQVLQQLRGVVERLEGTQLSLEEALLAFEDGVKLARRGSQILDAAEHRVEVLLRTDPVKTAPFPDAPENTK